MKQRLHYKKPAFWIILGAFLVCVAAAVLFLANPFAAKGDGLLLRVLNNKETFIKESGETVKLQDYIQSATADAASAPQRYARVDMDGDGEEELVVYIDCDEGKYLIFHSYGGEVYGFAFAGRDLQNLKADGTFLQSKSTYVNYYYAIGFSGAEYQLTELAYGNYEKSKARINGQEATTAEISDYSVSFWNKPAVQWISCTETVDPMPLYRDFLDNKITAKDNWQEKNLAYYLPAHGYHGYAFLDMTGDGVPELCVKEYKLHFFTVKNGELRHWYTEENGYSKLLSNGALFAEARDAGFQGYTYRILSENTSVAVRVTFEWWDGRYMDPSQVLPDRYVFNAQDVTKAEYEEKAKLYLELGSKEIQWQGVPEEPEETEPPVEPVPDKSYDDVLLSVLHSQRTFLAEAGESVYLKDYRLGAKLGVAQDIAAEPEKYALVDFDGDGTNELVVYVTPSFGAYLVFRVYENQVYGYEFGVRSMTGLNEDGSFTQSEGAGINYYATLCFEGTAYKLFEQAYYNDVDGVYRIGGKYATAEQGFAFIQDFSYREPAIWNAFEARADADYKTLYEAFLAGEKTAVLESGGQKTVYGFLGSAVDAGFTYTFWDMTGDGVPELFTNTSPFKYVFTIENGQILHLYSGLMMYYKLLNNGALRYERYGGAPAYKQYEYYEMDESGEVKLIISFSWNDSATVYPETYLIDNKAVTKAEYEEKTKPYLEIGDDKVVWYDQDGNLQ